MKKIIEIECLSDICIGFGTAISPNSDLDIAITDEGFPYIPSKRLKGLFKEAYLDLCDIKGTEPNSNYFGVEGITGNLFFSNAYIRGYKPGNYEYPSGLIKKAYTSQKVMTAIDDNTMASLEKSLRTIDVVNKGTVFVMTITTNDSFDELKDICKMVRHMGIHRNRGLGVVNVKIVDEINDLSSSAVLKLEDNLEYDIKLNITNIQPLLMAGKESDITESFISGSTLCGAYGSYLYNTDEFAGLFIDEKVKFSNAYPSNYSFEDFYPIPMYILKEKNTGVYVDSLALKKFQNVNNNSIKSDDGPKRKLKPVFDKYVSIKKDNTLAMVDLDYDYAYHHQRDTDNISAAKINEFYQYYAIRENQHFVGHIYGKGIDLKKLILPNEIYLGRSKNSQYGQCNISYTVNEIKSEKIQANKFIISAASDLKIKNELGIYTNDINEIKDVIATKFGLSSDDIVTYSVKYGTSGGYNMIWKKNKPICRTIKAGSYFVVETSNAKELAKKCFIGTDDTHGYGLLEIKPMFNPSSESECDFKIVENNASSKVVQCDTTIKAMIEKASIEEQLKSNAFDYVLNLKNTNVSASNINKAITILKNSNSFEEFASLLKKSDKTDKHLNPTKFRDVMNKFISDDDFYNSNSNYKIYYNYLFVLIKYNQRRAGK